MEKNTLKEKTPMEKFEDFLCGPVIQAGAWLGVAVNGLVIALMVLGGGK